MSRASMETRLLMACLLALSAVRDVSTSKECAPAKKSQSKLICYYSKLGDVSGCYCTHVILPSGSDVEAVEGLKARVKGVKVYVRVEEFDQGLINLLKSTKVDGLDINLKKLGSKTDIVDFISTVKTKIGSDLELFLSVPATPELLAKFFDFKALSKHVSAFILQTDFLGASANVTFHPSRLSGMWDMQNTDSLVDLVSGLGAPLSKLVITAPVQGYQFTLQNAEYTAPGSPALELKTVTRTDLCLLMGQGRNWTLERDEDQTGPYIFSENTWVAFEDEKSMDIKAKYSRIRGLAGMALKDVSQDDDAASCGSSILEIAHNGLSKQARAPRGAVLHSLEKELLESPGKVQDSVQQSPYRISRIVDTEGKVHVVRHDSRTEFQCSRQGYFVHPRSCNRFYRCVKFNQLEEEFDVFEFDCPAGLAFDERVEVCVWPGSLPHGTPCSGSSEIAPVPKERFACPSEPGYYADPENCRWFFACLDHGKSPLSAYEFRCPFGLAFDGERLACDWPWMVPKCADSYSRNSEYYYGAGNSAGAVLQNYDGLGSLGVVKLGGISGEIEKPVATIYSNVGGGAGTLGLQYQNNNGYVVGNGLGQRAVQSLQHSGLLRINNGAGSGTAHSSNFQTSGGNIQYSSQPGYDNRAGVESLGTERVHLDYDNSNGAVFGAGFVRQSENDLNANVYGGNSVNSHLGGFSGAQDEYSGRYNAANSQSSSQYHGQASGFGNADSIDIRAHTSQDTLPLQHVAVTPAYVIQHQNTPSSGYEHADVDAHTVRSDGRISGFADGRYSSNDVRYTGNTNNAESYQSVVHSPENFNQQSGINKLNGYTQQKEGSIRGNINIVGGGYSAVGSGIQVGAAGVTSPVGFTTASPISISTIPTVHSVPLPGIKTRLPFETYNGGVVANIPELQYRVHSHGDFGIRNVSANLLNVALTTPTPFTTSTSAVTQIYSQNTGVTGPANTFSLSTSKPLISSTPRPFGQEGVVYPKPSLAFGEGTSRTVESFGQEGYVYPQPSIAFGEAPVVVSTSKPFASTTVKTFDQEGYAYPKPSLAYGEAPTSKPTTVLYQTHEQNTQYHDVSTTGPSIVVERKPELFASTTPINYLETHAQNGGYVYDKPAVQFETHQRVQPVIVSKFSIRKELPVVVHPHIPTSYQEPRVQQPLVELYKQPQLLSTYTYQPAYKNEAPVSTYTYQNVAQAVVGLYPKSHAVYPIANQTQNEHSGYVKTGQDSHSSAGQGAIGLVKTELENSGYVQTHSGSPGYVSTGPSTPGFVIRGHGSSGYVQAHPHSSGYVIKGQSSPGYVKTEHANSGYVQAGQSSAGIVNSGQESSGYVQTHPESPGYVITGQSRPGYVTAGQEISGYVHSAHTSAGLVNVGQENSGYVQAHPESSGYVIAGQSSPGYVKSEHGSSGNELAGQTSAGFVNAGQEGSGYVQTHPESSGYVYGGQLSPSYVKTGVESSGNVQSAHTSAGFVNAGQGNSGYVQTHPESSGYVITGHSSPGYVRAEHGGSGNVQAGQTSAGFLNTGQESSGYVQEGRTSVDFANAAIDNSGYVQIQSVSPGYITAGQSGTGYVTPGQQNIGFIKEEHQNSGGYAHTNQKSQVTGYSYPQPQVTFSENPRLETPCGSGTCFESKRIQPVSIGTYEFSTPKPHITGYTYSQPSGSTALKTAEEGYVYPKPSVIFEEKPTVVTPNYNLIVSSTPQPQILVHNQPSHQYIPTARPEYKETEFKGYDYPKPSVQLVEEKPFIKKTAYVTGHQQPVVVENYQHPNYERVKQYILSQQSNIEYEQPQVYVSSTPRPSFISTVQAIATKQVAPVTPASVTVYDSRLTSTPTLVDSRPTIVPYYSTTVAPELKVVSSTSRPVSRFSFSSLDDQYQYSQYRSAIDSSTALPSVSYTPVSREYLPVEVSTPSREYLPAREIVKITSTTAEPEITTLSRDYLPLRTRLKIASTGIPLDQPELIKIVPKTVIKQNDYHPLLSAKLGAQCTCVSNSIRLRKKQKVIVVDDDDDDDGYVVGDYKEPERLVGFRGGYSSNDVTPATSDADVLKAVKTGLQLVKEAAKEGAKEGTKQALDRYGSGGVRSRSETLQGSVDCQRAGLFRHPTECNRFYACRWDCTKKRFTLHVFNCPVHLTFDNNLGACNWPSQGPACVANTLITSD